MLRSVHVTLEVDSRNQYQANTGNTVWYNLIDTYLSSFVKFTNPANPPLHKDNLELECSLVVSATYI